MKKTTLALALAGIACGSQPVVAESQNVDQTILVTATRTAQSIDETLASVSVINSAEISRLQPYDLLHLLSLTPGVDVSRAGSKGSNASLYLRGTNAGHALVLVDGARVGSATLGTVSLQHINPAQIDRIEIVRGPRSSLYGSEALGGVIQIFTKKLDNNFKPVIKIGVGSDESYEYSAAIGGKVNATSVNVALSHSDTDGIDSQIFDGYTDSDNDAYRNTSAAVTLEHSWSNGANLALSYYKAKGENEHDQGDAWGANPEAAPFNAIETESQSASLSAPVTESWTSIVSLGRSLDRSKARDDNIVNTDEFVTVRDQAAWQNNIQLNDAYLLTLGYEYYEDVVSGSQTYAKDHRSNRALFTQLQGQLSEAVDIVVAHRRDDNEQFGYQTTYNVALGFDIDSAHRLIVSRGTAFKAPTFNDLYWPASAWTASNPDLLPEESDNWDIELRGNYDGLSLSLTAYKNEVDNLIEWAETAPWFWQPSNVSKAEIKGAEISLKTSLAGWDINSVASYVAPEEAATGNTLARRARKTLALQVDRGFGPLSVGADWKVQSHRYDETANTTRLAGYGSLDLRLGYQFSPTLKAQLKIENVFDQDYQLNADYHTEGTTALFSLSYSM